MMNRIIHLLQIKRLINMGTIIAPQFGKRTILSEAYSCEEAWSRRLESPLLRKIKMDQYFVETDKKFNTKNAVSGIDIDLFANNIQHDSQLEEVEHLLYKFRRTKRSVEMMDSTIYAVVRAFLRFQNYEALFRILKNQDSYGIFPDFYLYNLLMDTFIEKHMFKEAAEVAILMMLQEDFSNEISCLMALYSCQMFLKNCTLDSLGTEKILDVKEGEDEEETLVRVPHLRNPWFDDHFHLTKPEHLIGKTFFLVGRCMDKDPLGKSYYLLGLAMYEKWENVLHLMDTLVKLDDSPVLISGGVEQFKKYITSISSDDMKNNLENLLTKLYQSNKIKMGELEHELTLKLKASSELESHDIVSQQRLFIQWEQERQLALEKQNLTIDKEKRLAEIQRKKDYLYWKEKLLFFFENEDKYLEEFQDVQEVKELLKSKQTGEDTYVPPEIIKKATEKLTKYQRLAKVKKL